MIAELINGVKGDIHDRKKQTGVVLKSVQTTFLLLALQLCIFTAAMSDLWTKINTGLNKTIN